jgi:aspartate/methionine/tyrosine aminotransferase
MIKTADRMACIKPFHVMDILARAHQLEAEGKEVFHMEVGEPDFVTLAEISEAGRKALAEGKIHYTAATGLPLLREAISDYYLREYNRQVAAERIVVTPGASGALQLVLGVTINPGEGVLMSDPGYPCNRHMVSMFGGEVQPVPVDADSEFQLNLELVKKYWQVNSKAVMLASPSNPTGTIIASDELRGICEYVRARQGVVIVDEIYHGLIYEGMVETAADYADNVIVINSFSKYFGMTGWRVGWLVAPEELIKPIDHLAQNIFLAAPTPSQHAAVTALSPSMKPALDERRDVFRQRRDYLVAAIKSLGFEVPVYPRGAFYVYANSTGLAEDSLELSRQLLEHAGVAITPGIDFGDNHHSDYVRLAYTTSIENLEAGIEAIRGYLNRD